MPERAEPLEPPPGGVWIEYKPLDDLLGMARDENPKDHDLGLIHESINKHGFRGAVMIDERTKRLQAGHGRLEVLVQKRDGGESAPAGIVVTEDGTWTVPVLRGEAWRSDADARAYVVVDNKATMAGGWVDAKLAEVLQGTLAELGSLEGTGYDLDELDALLADLAGGGASGEGGGAGAAPDEFQNFDDETIPTEHSCPQCGYKWSGGT